MKTKPMPSLLPDTLADPNSISDTDRLRFLDTEVLFRLVEHDPGEPKAPMVRSVKLAGVLEPVLVMEADNGMRVLDGIRRIKAAHKAKRPLVPAYVVPGDELKGGDVRLLSLVANFHRSSNAAGEFNKIKELAGEYSAERIAKEAGIPLGTIRRRIKLIALLPYLQSAFSEGAISLGVAEAALKLSTVNQQALADTLAKNGKLTSADVAELKKAQAMNDMQEVMGDVLDMPMPQATDRAKAELHLGAAVRALGDAGEESLAHSVAGVLKELTGQKEAVS